MKDGVVRSVDSVAAIDVARVQEGAVAGAESRDAMGGHVGAEERFAALVEVVRVARGAGGVAGGDEEIIEAGGGSDDWREVFWEGESVWRGEGEVRLYEEAQSAQRVAAAQVEARVGARPDLGRDEAAGGREVGEMAVEAGGGMRKGGGAKNAEHSETGDRPPKPIDEGYGRQKEG